MCWKGWDTMTSQFTFEKNFRQALLDLIYKQWSELGAPFSERGGVQSESVIDPEALIWCSLEFLPTEPRLCEFVVEWIAENENQIVRQRIIKASKPGDPRNLLWRLLDRRTARKKTDATIPSEPFHGLTSGDEVTKFINRFSDRLGKRDAARPIGRIQNSSATLLLRARDLFGHDIRHFLLVYLLAHPQGGKLRNLQKWSGHGYRSLADAAVRWEASGIVTLESGFCRLIEREPFCKLLHIQSSEILLDNWSTVFETSIRILRDLAKARSKGFGPSDQIVESLKNRAEEKLRGAALAFDTSKRSPVHQLLSTFEVIDLTLSSK